LGCKANGFGREKLRIRLQFFPSNKFFNYFELQADKRVFLRLKPPPLKAQKDKIKLLEAEVKKLKKEIHDLRGEGFPSGNTVKVPKEFKPIFDKAQKTVGKYFSRLEHDPTHGTIEINDQRYLLIRASALSYEFFQAFVKFYSNRGEEEATLITRNILFDMAHVIGMEDARNFHKRMNLKDPISKLSAGPVHFAYTGWAFVDILPESKPSPDDNYFLKYHHPFSFEADSWIRAGKKSTSPVCIMNAGYSSGWCEQSFGFPLTAVEISCKAKGDKNCTFIMAPPHMIDKYLGKGEQKREKKKIEVPSFLQRKKIEDQLKNSLNEKEILLKEIHHRVKNNLQIVSSLLNLQAATIEDPSSREKIQESIGRIKSMAMIHELLYSNKSFSMIPIKEYFHSLVNFIKSTYQLENKISVSLVIKLNEEAMDIDKAIPCGLILNEMLSNSMKYAFKGKDSGTIQIVFSDFQEDGKRKYSLLVEDNGIGISKKIDYMKAESLGLQLITSLVSQLDGTITLDTSKGTKFTIHF
jgi:two-component sensor histidine kinase/predicted hydrocarbon binding protein